MNEPPISNEAELTSFRNRNLQYRRESRYKSGLAALAYIRTIEKNDGRETASNQAHHYRYVLDDDLTPETRHYVETVIAKFRTVNPDIPMKAANAQGAQASYEREARFEPELCTNPDCEWAWTRHGGECS